MTCVEHRYPRMFSSFKSARLSDDQERDDMQTAQQRAHRGPQTSSFLSSKSLLSCRLRNRAEVFSLSLQPMMTAAFLRLDTYAHCTHRQSRRLVISANGLALFFLLLLLPCYLSRYWLAVWCVKRRRGRDATAYRAPSELSFGFPFLIVCCDSITSSSDACIPLFFSSSSCLLNKYTEEKETWKCVGAGNMAICPCCLPPPD